MDELRAHWRRQERQLQRFSLFVIHHLTAITSDRRCDPASSKDEDCGPADGDTCLREHQRPMVGWNSQASTGTGHGSPTHEAVFCDPSLSDVFVCGVWARALVGNTWDAIENLLMSAKVAELAISSLRFEDVTDRETFAALEPDEPE